MARRVLLITILLTACATMSAFCEKFFDKPNDAVGKVSKFGRLAELFSFNYAFHGPQYADFTVEVGETFPQESNLDLTFWLDFGTNTIAGANITGEWKSDGSIIYKPYGERPKVTIEGQIGEFKITVVSDILVKNSFRLTVEFAGLRNDWYSRMRVRSLLKTTEGEVSDEIGGIWIFPTAVERFGGAAAPELPPADVIPLGDELGAMLTGLFEFNLDDSRGVLQVTRHNGQYFARMAWYSGEITEGPLYILRIYEPLKKRKEYTIAAVDIAFKGFFGSETKYGEQRPKIILLEKFDGLKAVTQLEKTRMSFLRGDLSESTALAPFELYRVDRDLAKYPGRKEYLERLTEEKYVKTGMQAYKHALALFNCIASEDWGPGYELGRLGGYENKQYIAARALKMASLVDHFADTDAALRERALQLRWRLHTDINSVPVLKNEDVTRAVRMPILVYIFRKTDAKLDWMTMKTEFSDDDVKKIKRGLSAGSEQLFNETFGSFTPYFDFYNDRAGAKELPPVEHIGTNLLFKKNEGGEKLYDLLLERMLQYTIYPNSYEPNSDYLPLDKFEELGLSYPAIFLIGKVDTKTFKNAISTRAQSEPELKNAKLSTGLAYTRGIERGKPAYCHIVLDDGFKSDDVKEILLWAMVLICIDNLEIMKKRLTMKYLQEGDKMLHDPYSDIDKFKCKLGTEAWWNAYLNVYMTYGMKKLLAYGRRPYYIETAIKYPQLLADLFKLERTPTFVRDLAKFGR